MNGYLAFYRGLRHEVHAETSFEARTKAAAHFKVKPNKAYEVTVMLAEKSGQQVTHVPTF